MSSNQLVQYFPFVMPVLMVVAAVSDVRSFRIPNWLTALVALLFFPAAFLFGMPSNQFLWHVGTGIVLFFFGYGLFALRLFGGGDAKLMAAAGLWFGASHTMNFLISTALAGGVLVIAICFLAYLQFHSEIQGTSLSQSIKKLAPKVPYGVALAAGAIIAFPESWWMNHVI